MKKALCMLFSVILTLTLVSCAEKIKTETMVVEATIVDVDCDPMRRVGTTYRRADYDILLKYEDITTWIDVTRSEYEKYKYLVGTTIEVNFVADYYSDNTMKQYLKLIEE
jgi:hypothetical protein